MYVEQKNKNMPYDWGTHPEIYIYPLGDLAVHLQFRGLYMVYICCFLWSVL